jgi:hypothetical protein
VKVLRACVVVLGSLMLPAAAAAQEAPRSAVDVSAGYAGFVDESLVDHVTVGGAWRWQATPRVSLGPELVVMRGPGGDRDVFLTGKLVVDLASPRFAVQPYLVADAGVFFHREAFLSGSFWSREGAVSGGAGIRVPLTDRLFVGGELRVGWEAHVRATGVLGWRLGRP